MARQPDALKRVAQWVADHDVDVDYEPGWRTHGGRRFAPKGFTVHHDASPRDSEIRHIIRDGHSTLPGPLANLYLTRPGTLVVIAAGRANHAGRGGWQGLRGNSSVWGLEIANNGQGEPYGDEQLRVVRLLMRAFHVVDGVPIGLIHSHHEWRSEKPDPAVDPETRSGPWHMDRFRRELRTQSEPDPKDDDMAKLEVWTGKDPEGNEGVFLVQRGPTGDGHAGTYLMLTPDQADEYKALGEHRADIVVSTKTAHPSWFHRGGLKRV